MVRINGHDARHLSLKGAIPKGAIPKGAIPKGATGLSAAEAIAAGCFPLLPNRLAYPELLQEYAFPNRGVETELLSHFYNEASDCLLVKIRAIDALRTKEGWPTTTDSADTILKPFSIAVRAQALDRALVQLVESS